MSTIDQHHKTIQVKICGLTRPDQAVQCAALGADAIGMVFYAPSPRNVSVDTARAITSAVTDTAVPVAVVVDQALEDILKLTDQTGIRTVQLHAPAAPAMIEKLKNHGLAVIRHVTGTAAALTAALDGYGQTPVIVECTRGPLPGGNGLDWDYAQAHVLTGRVPMILAGGLTCNTVARAIAASGCAAVDVSSAVESSGGIKDMAQVKTFIQNAKRVVTQHELIRIF